jgi:hypothetical protein
MEKYKGILGEMISQLGEKEAFEQFRIKWSNTYANSLSGHWRKYEYPSTGNMLHWLHAFGSFELAENAIVGSEIVKIHGRFVASYKMNDDLKRPVFNFIEKYKWMQMSQDLFTEGFKRPEITQPIIDNYNEIKEQWNTRMTLKS